MSSRSSWQLQNDLEFLSTADVCDHLSHGYSAALCLIATLIVPQGHTSLRPCVWHLGHSSPAVS